MSNHVFISYSTHDATYVFRLAALMRATGLIPWYFQESERYGEDYVRQLMIAIEGAVAMILVLSRHSADSTSVLQEVLHAYSVGQRIIVVWLEDASGRVVFLIHPSNWIDVRHGQDPLPHLMDALKRVRPLEPPIVYLKAEEGSERFIRPNYLPIDLIHRIPAQITPWQEEFEICTIGARDDRGIIIHADFIQVSRCHAFIKARIDTHGRWHFRLYDTSKNGTWVNNERIPYEQPHDLHHADRIELLKDIIALQFGIRGTTISP